MLVEQLYCEAPGYHPFLIKKYWQVAQLNYSAEQHPDHIRELEVHRNTDETFTLLRGSAFLIATADENSDIELLWMEQGHTYNVPAGVWHNIAMNEGSSVLITENARTHEEKKQLLLISEDMQQQIKKFSLQEDIV